MDRVRQGKGRPGGRGMARDRRPEIEEKNNLDKQVRSKKLRQKLRQQFGQMADGSDSFQVKHKGRQIAFVL